MLLPELEKPLNKVVPPRAGVFLQVLQVKALHLVHDPVDAGRLQQLQLFSEQYLAYRRLALRIFKHLSGLYFDAVVQQIVLKKLRVVCLDRPQHLDGVLCAHVKLEHRLADQREQRIVCHVLELELHDYSRKSGVVLHLLERLLQLEAEPGVESAFRQNQSQDYQQAQLHNSGLIVGNALQQLRR